MSGVREGAKTVGWVSLSLWTDLQVIEGKDMQQNKRRTEGEKRAPEKGIEKERDRRRTRQLPDENLLTNHHRGIKQPQQTDRLT